MSINQNYLMPDDSAVALPFLMASDYQPRTVQDNLNLCVTREVLEQLPEEIQIVLAQNEQSIVAGGERKEAYSLAHARWVILAKPNSYYVFDKAIDRIRKRVRGEEWTSNLSTVARVFLACMIGENLVMDTNKNIQIFTLKLSGTRCSWIYKGDRSMIGLNKALLKKWNLPGGTWLTHLVSVGIEPVPYMTEYQGQTNIRTRFQFAEGSGANPLSELQQAACFQLIQGDEFKALMDDPFGVERATSTPSPEVPQQSTGGTQDLSEAEYEEIPF